MGIGAVLAIPEGLDMVEVKRKRNAGQSTETD